VIIWRNEATSPSLSRTGILKDPPPGPVEITRVEESGVNYHVWFVPVPARPAREPDEERP